MKRRVRLEATNFQENPDGQCVEVREKVVDETNLAAFLSTNDVRSFIYNNLKECNCVDITAYAPGDDE